MGHQELAKAERRLARKILGNETALWAMKCVEVIKLRGFWGRMKWLVFGK